MFRRTGAIIALVGLYFLAAQIGNSFGQVLTIFSIFMWVIAGGMFVYLMLFKGMKMEIFSKKVANDNSDDNAFDETGDVNDEVEVADVDSGSVVRRLPVAD